MNQAPQDLFDAAFSVLNHSYSPYSNFKVACALRTVEASVYVGCNVENAAYPLSSCAEASAISAMISSGQHQIKEALILVDDAHVATPCGACRQRLFEFSNADTIVHMCTVSHLYQQTRLHELLPFAFELDRG